MMLGRRSFPFGKTHFQGRTVRLEGWNFSKLVFAGFLTKAGGILGGLYACDSRLFGIYWLSCEVLETPESSTKDWPKTWRGLRASFFGVYQKSSTVGWFNCSRVLLIF